MEKSNKDFEIFKREFEKYRQCFGLTGFATFYQYEPTAEGFAHIDYSLSDMSAIVTLNSEPPTRVKGYPRNIRKLAKHEAIHLLLARLTWNANMRYTTQDVVNEVEEEIVIKLEGLIP